MNYFGQITPSAGGRPAEPQYNPTADATTPLVEPPKPARGYRQRMNLPPIFIAFVVPCLLFAGVAFAIAFSLHYDHQAVMYLIVGAALVATLSVGGFAFNAPRASRAKREPNWLMFLFLALLAAFFLACACGSTIYNSYMLEYYDFSNLNNYVEVYPTRSRGEQVMDAGYIVFANGTFLDLPKSMGFKNMDVYCVAPIAYGDSTLDTYDFWAVGKNCCDGTKSDFHCDDYKNPNARSGLRLMSDTDRAYYRLAVQQAEATYKIRAEHPLFFEWTQDASGQLDGWKDDAFRDYYVWTGSFSVVMFFLVLSTTVCFSKYAA